MLSCIRENSIDLSGAESKGKGGRTVSRLDHKASCEIYLSSFINMLGGSKY